MENNEGLKDRFTGSLKIKDSYNQDSVLLQNNMSVELFIIDNKYREHNIFSYSIRKFSDMGR
jgi:hypothetical protein